MVENIGKDFKLYLKASGTVRRSPDDPWTPVSCYVAFDDVRDHQQIVESFFRDHPGHDLEFMRKQHADHFHDPANVAYAIALYHYFRNRSFFFKDAHWKPISADDVPSRQPEALGETFAVWVDFDR